MSISRIPIDFVPIQPAFVIDFYSNKFIGMKKYSNKSLSMSFKRVRACKASVPLVNILGIIKLLDY